jgi:PAS domain S-box-containing protein/putative nucleotidyltransferase with HDIG domain
MQLGVTIADTKGKIIYTNPTEARLHGYTVEKLIGKSVRIFAPKELWNTRTCQELQTTKSYKRESVNICKDGSTFPAQIHSDVLKNKEGNTVAIITTCEEISERKKMEDALRTAHDELERRVEERTEELLKANALLKNEITQRKLAEKRIKAQLDRIDALRSIDVAINASLDLRLTLDILLDHVLKQLKIDAATVLLFNKHTQLLQYVVGKGFRSNALRHTRLRLGEGHSGRAAMERHIITIHNIQEKPDGLERSNLLANEEFIFFCAVPLVAKGQVKGVLELFHRASLDSKPEWLEFLEALAEQAAIAIDNASLFDEVQRSNTELIMAYESTIEGWSRAMDLRDKETEGHSQRVTELTLSIARELGIKETEHVHIRRGALLHDMGKMGVPDGILLKPGSLNDEEWVIMKRHTIYAYEMLSPIEYLRPAIDIPYCHHEKWDGTGYPRGLKGEEIPLSARIFALVDVWDALNSDRPYRPAWPREKIINHISSLSGTHFDPNVVEVFFKLKW